MTSNKRNTKAKAPRIPEEGLPEHMCSECWYYDPIEIEHGSCYGIPPTTSYDKDGDLVSPRPIVLTNDKGCHLWRSRHGVH